MSKGNSMGGGLQTEMSSVRFRMSQNTPQPSMMTTTATTASAPVAPAVPKRKVLVFHGKLPAVSKRAKKTSANEIKKSRVVLNVKVRSPALQRRLGL